MKLIRKIVTPVDPEPYEEISGGIQKITLIAGVGPFQITITQRHLIRFNQGHYEGVITENGHVVLTFSSGPSMHKGKITVRGTCREIYNRFRHSREM